MLPPTWAKSLTKLNTKIQDFKRIFGLKLQVKEGWNNFFQFAFKFKKFSFFK